MINRNILISGAGISGLTLAYWLKLHGCSPTVVEKRPDLDARGYMIDFYGSGYDIAERMGLIEEMADRSSRYPVSKLEFVDGDGAPRATLDVEKFRRLLDHRYFPILRGDLESAIYQSVRGGAPIRFNASIRRLEQRMDSVEVEFTDGTGETYDLVIGADGIHSNVRRLVWGEEAQFKRNLGFHVACGVIDDFFGKPDAFYANFSPGAQSTVYSIGNNRLAVFFGFKSEPLDARTREQQLEVLVKRFGKLGWVYPRLLEGIATSDDFFFDAVAQIHLDDWHKGRVALVGDACQCLTLLAGQGASMGMAGAYLLAEALKDAEGDYETAFRAYQSKLQPEILRRQIDARGLAGSFIPESNFGITLTYFFLKTAFLPGFRALFKNQIGARSIIK